MSSNKIGTVSLPDFSSNEKKSFRTASSFMNYIAQQYGLQKEDVVNIILGSDTPNSYKNVLTSSEVMVPPPSQRELEQIFTSNYQGNRWVFFPSQIT